MKIRVLDKVRKGHKELCRYAKDIEDAYEQGYFTSGMTFDEFMARITKKNPAFRLHRTATHTGLFDVDNNQFVCGVSRFSRIPRFTIMKHDPAKDKVCNYTDEHGNLTSSQVVNTDDEKGKVLARSWIAVFNLLKGQGYEVDDEDIDY